MEPFKNNFSPKLVANIADHLAKHIKNFDRDDFEKPILKQLKKLELKERSHLIAEHVHRVLPKNTKRRYRILLKMLHPEEESAVKAPMSELGIRGWGIMPLTRVVGYYGTENFDESMALLKEMTKRFTAEFDIRYFLLADQERTLEILSEWTQDPSEHVRRLASEGTRPRLPWAMQLPKLIEDPTPCIPLLNALKDDNSEYVRRSVANHLNDIAKDHPKLVVDIAKKWMKGADKNRQRLLKHACRTLIKQGDKAALEVFGYGKAKVEVGDVEINTPLVKMGEQVEFQFSLRSKAKTSQQLIIDYAIHFQKSNGQQAPKVFKWKTLELPPNKSLSLKRTHTIKHITTRKHYPGTHSLSLKINGNDLELGKFVLEI